MTGHNTSDNINKQKYLHALHRFLVPLKKSVSGFGSNLYVFCGTHATVSPVICSESLTREMLFLPCVVIPVGKQHWNATGVCRSMHPVTVMCSLWQPGLH